MAKQSVIYDDDAPEMTSAELAEFRPAREVLSPEEFATVSAVRRGRPKADETKVAVSIRLNREVVEAFKADGPGWQTRVNDALTALVSQGRVQVPALAAVQEEPKTKKNIRKSTFAGKLKEAKRTKNKSTPRKRTTRKVA